MGGFDVLNGLKRCVLGVLDTKRCEVVFGGAQ